MKDKFYKYNLIGGSITVVGMMIQEYTETIFFIGLAIQFYALYFYFKDKQMNKRKKHFSNLDTHL